MYAKIFEILRDFIFLFYPDYCEGCSTALVKGEHVVCTGCILEMPRTHYHEDTCNPLMRKFHGRIPLVRALAFLKFRKKGIVQKMLHALKYRNRPEIGIVLGRVYAHDLDRALSLHEEFDMIIPVPLHPSRQRQRGYNQSEKWAEGLSSGLKLPVRNDVLIRIAKTKSQTRRTKLSRWQNVKEVFHVKNPEAVRGKRILLADDVVTTGATLESCGHLLLESGCHSIGIICIAAAQ